MTVPPPGLFPWGHPSEAFLEPGIAETCARINTTGWVWTAESCHGHLPETDEDRAWLREASTSGRALSPAEAARYDDLVAPWRFPRPLIRFVLETRHTGHLLQILAMTAETGWVEIVPCVPGEDPAWSTLKAYAHAPEDRLDVAREMFARAAARMLAARP